MFDFNEEDKRAIEDVMAMSCGKEETLTVSREIATLLKGIPLGISMGALGLVVTAVFSQFLENFKATKAILDPILQDLEKKANAAVEIKEPESKES